MVFVTNYQRWKNKNFWNANGYPMDSDCIG